jgi:two-component system nitrogen regulation response regulator GlnG
MAPTQLIEDKDLPPELLGEATLSSQAPASAQASVVAATQAPAAPVSDPVVQTTMAASTAARHTSGDWLKDLEREARQLLDAGQPDVWDTLTRRFEAQLIHTALEITRGRRIEAAQKLGIGRNTITRKIQELGLDD